MLENEEETVELVHDLAGAALTPLVLTDILNKVREAAKEPADTVMFSRRDLFYLQFRKPVTPPVEENLPRPGTPEIYTTKWFFVPDMPEGVIRINMANATMLVRHIATA